MSASRGFRRRTGALGVAVLAVLACVLGGSVSQTLAVADTRIAEAAATSVPVSCSSTVAAGADLSTVIGQLRPGDTLCLRGGTYRQDVNRTVPSGAPSARITMRSHPGERAVIHGNTTFVGANHWTISDLEFTNPATSNPIVRILGGSGWIFERNEVHDGNYAGVLVARSSTAGVPHDYIIRYNTIHDTRASNLYHNPSRHSTGGLIERNLFFNSADAQNIKLGWGGTNVCTGSNYENFGIGEVTVRYNTLHNAFQPLTVAEPGGDRRVEVHHNLIGKGTRGYLVRIDNVEGCLGNDVSVHHNAGFGATRFAEDFGDQPTVMGKMTGNFLASDPRFDSTTAGGFDPANGDLQPYGRYGWASAEQRLVDKLNAERRAQGLPAVRVDTELVRVARTWAGEMARGDSLSPNPSLSVEVQRDWLELSQSVGSEQRTGASENELVDLLHAALMASAPHRASVLRPDFEWVGAGVRVAPNGTMWLAVNFMRTTAGAVPPAPSPTPAPTSAPGPSPTPVTPVTPPTAGPNPSPPAEPSSPQEPPPVAGRFADVTGGPHAPAVEAIARRGVTQGCGGDLFCPNDLVNRGQMAAFLVRALELPPAERGSFGDVVGSTHEAAINSLAAAGITGGCAEGRFCPAAPVTRAQMGSFLQRAFELPPAQGERFDDVSGTSAHQPAINAIAEAGITQGCAERRYCPQQSVRRAEMASFLARALGLV